MARSFRPYSPSGRRVTSIVIIVAVLALLVVRISRRASTPSGEDRFKVVEIIDGDTFRIASGDKVRLANIDTPEHGEPGFDEATAGLARLIGGRQIRIDYKEQTRDKYGRLVGYVYVDTILVDESMVSQGLGCVYLLNREEFDRPEVRRLIAAQQEALDARRGIWSFHHEPEEYYVSVNGLRFHRPGCSHISNVPRARQIRFESREQALRQGLSPCRSCRP